jgi:Holliday junction resolvasome RuvABC DNA-binding subunit
MNNSNSELIVALQSFGFSMKEIQHALSSIEQSAQMPQDMPSQIKLVLKYLGK